MQLIGGTNFFPYLPSSLVLPHLLNLSSLPSFPVSASHPKEIRNSGGSWEATAPNSVIYVLEVPYNLSPSHFVLLLSLPSFLPPSLSQLLFSFSPSFLCFCCCHLPIMPLGLLQNKLCTRPNRIRLIPRFMFHSFSTDFVTTVAMRKMLCCTGMY